MRLVYSSSFKDVLNRMPDNDISIKLLELENTKSEELKYSYISTTDVNDLVLFTSKRTVKDKLSDIPEKWIINTKARFLKKNDKNRVLYKNLRYRNSYEEWEPKRNNIGVIIREKTGQISGKTYVTFKDPESNKVAVVNKSVLNYYLDPEVHGKMLLESNNQIKVGRLVRNILISSNISFIESDIEIFINLFKSTHDFISNRLSQFKIVSGNDIKKWYDQVNYVSGGGTLNSSCMRHVDSNYFNIYSKNKNVSLIILYSDDGRVINGKYTSNKIKGRALLWKGKIDGIDGYYMDRIYTRNDSDNGLFKELAKKNGYYFNNNNGSLTNGNFNVNFKVEIKLKKSIFDYYPYMDNMCYIDTTKRVVTNFSTATSNRYCKSTGGNYSII
jgi:uncharacterized pyridoxamine 5'-phosphate oxidase family protein